MQRQTLSTARLRLRPSAARDADRAFEIQSDWAVARMLSMADYPPSLDTLSRWFARHADEWAAGLAYRFAVEHDGTMIGLVDLDGVTDEEATLGYWIERSAWGQGLAFEAASAVLTFALNGLCLKRLKAGHAADNPASGRVLTKLGFRLVDKITGHSKSRGLDIEQWRYVYAPPLT